MHILAIDIGTYSVKYISSFVDKRKVTHTEMSEIIVRDFMSDRSELSVEEAQLSIVQEIMDTVARADTKIIYQINNEILSTRFLTLPVKNKKKAELMLPFQLEEDIPYALSEIQYAYRLESQKSQFTAMVEMVKENVFDDYHTALAEKNILPQILTSESSVVENFFNQNTMAGPFCVLDIGHKTTKGYFFYNSRLLITHTSYMGGKNINDMIADTYKIEPDEAIFYKHQNAFLLTSNQYQEVEDAQREFAGAMDKVFAPLIADFMRWKVGLKVNYGLSLQSVYVCGGTANVKNITNYLSEKLEVKVSLLESFDKVEAEKVDINAKSKCKYALANMMAFGFKKKNRFINLLTGKYAPTGAAEIPLHSLAYIGVRVVTATAVLAISLLTERVFIQKDIGSVNAKITSLARKEELQISGRMRRQISQDPKPVYDLLVKKQKGVRQEISTLQSAVQIKALAPLVTVSQIAARSQATLIDFKVTDMNEITAIFSSESADDLNSLKSQFERSSLNDVTASLNTAKLQLTIKAQGN